MTNFIGPLHGKRPHFAKKKVLFKCKSVRLYSPDEEPKDDALFLKNKHISQKVTKLFTYFDEFERVNEL